MNGITILAQTVETADTAPQAAEQGFVPVNFIWEQITALNLVEAITFICFGVVCLFYGLHLLFFVYVFSFEDFFFSQ